MKYGYNSKALDKMTDTCYGNGPTLEMALFVINGYSSWMKRKTCDKREQESFEMFLEAVEEMKEHYKEMKKK